MDGLEVLVWALVGLRLVALVLQIAVARAKQAACPVRRSVDPCLGPVTGLPPRPLPTAEDVLEARLFHGAMSREDYRAEMARLAAQDELSHPLPPIGPDRAGPAPGG